MKLTQCSWKWTARQCKSHFKTQTDTIKHIKSMCYFEKKTEIVVWIFFRPDESIPTEADISSGL